MVVNEFGFARTREGGGLIVLKITGRPVLTCSRLNVQKIALSCILGLHHCTTAPPLKGCGAVRCSSAGLPLHLVHRGAVVVHMVQVNLSRIARSFLHVRAHPMLKQSPSTM
jgi:hypothetical protein